MTIFGYKLPREVICDRAVINIIKSYTRIYFLMPNSGVTPIDAELSASFKELSALEQGVVKYYYENESAKVRATVTALYGVSVSTMYRFVHQFARSTASSVAAARPLLLREWLGTRYLSRIDAGGFYGYH